MPVRPIFIICLSFISAIYSVIHIYRLAVPSFRYTESLLANSISETPPTLILDPVFWFWTILAWISAYFLIRNYLILRES